MIWLDAESAWPKQRGWQFATTCTRHTRNFTLEVNFRIVPRQTVSATIPLQYLTSTLKAAHMVQRFCGCSVGKGEIPPVNKYYA